MSKTEHAASKDAAISTKRDKKTDTTKKNVRITQLVIVSVIDILIALFVYAVASLVCGEISESCIASYFTVLFLPLISFLTALASLLLTKNIPVCFTVNVALTAVIYLIYRSHP